MNKLRILLTGGHAGTTGIAVIEEIRNTPRLKDSEIFWIGSKTAIEGTKLATLESQELPKMGVKFHGITSGKLQTKFTKYTISSLLKIPIGFIQALIAVFKIKPKITLSFGGYTSFPVVFWSWFFGIPVILHEQTTSAGRASLLSQYFAKKITLAREESQKYFQISKTVVVGDPIMKNILVVAPPTSHLPPFTILVMGGSRGSEFINDLITKIRSNLLKKSYKILHLAGGKKNIEPAKMGEYYQRSDIILSRSGANSVSEIMFVKRPAILIPLPRTFLDEQYKNAKFAENFGVAKVLTESEATPKRVEVEIDNIVVNWDKIVMKIQNKISPDIDASKKVVDIINSYI